MPDPLVVPVFPLPDVVFFPRTVLPLHVFETRYRAMVKDALQGDHTLVVALLQPGWEQDYQGSPALHPVATLGRMEGVETTRDGRYHFRLVGLHRVRLLAAERETPYRLMRAEHIPERAVDDSDPEIRRAKLDLLASQVCLMHELAGKERPLVLDETMSFEAAVNGTCASLPIEPAGRQALLEIDDLRIRHQAAGSILDELLDRILRLKSLRGRDEGENDIN